MAQEPKKPINKDSISVVVRNRQGILLQEDAKAFSSFNEKGVFDVLPEHANFISIIKDSFVIHRKAGDKREMKINQGILRVHENEVHVFLDVVPNANNLQK